MPIFKASESNNCILFRAVISVLWVLSFNACANNNSTKSVTWTKASTHQLRPGDMLSAGTDEAGVNSAGYLALGLVGLKSLDRAKDIVLNKSTSPRLEKCEKLTPSQLPDGRTQIIIEAAHSAGSCAGWANKEALVAAVTNSGQITSLAKSDLDNANEPALRFDETASPRATHIGLNEKYTLTANAADPTKSIYSFNYTATLDYSYVQTIVQLRNITKPGGISTGRANVAAARQPPPHNKDTEQNDAANTNETPNRRKPNPANPQNSIKGPLLHNIAKITIVGDMDLSDPKKPMVTLRQLSVAVDYQRGSNVDDAVTAFTSDISLAKPTEPMLMICGVPEGSVSLTQNFEVAADSKNNARNNTFHPVLNLKNNQITSTSAKYGMSLHPCTPNNGLSDLKSTIITADLHMISSRSFNK